MENKSSLLLIDDEESVCIDVRDLLKKEAFGVEYRLSAEDLVMDGSAVGSWGGNIFSLIS